jgi:two-component system OmpR family response regulator
MRLLLVEDDRKIAFFVKTGLQEAGFSVTHTSSGLDGLQYGLSEPFDVCVIDVMLPEMDGLSLIKTLREQGVLTPVLILSAKRTVDERIAGFTAGSDDYLTKPFAFSELLARIQALMRRASQITSSPELKVADLTLDVHSRKVTRAGQSIFLQRLEFSLLEYLMLNAGRIVSKTMIMEHVWDYDFNPQTNVVESRICYLRNKIDKGFDPKLIHTIRGVGYVLREDN